MALYKQFRSFMKQIMKMSSKDCFYVFSNGGKDYFPSNSLTNFTNKFPIPFEVDKRYEIGVQSIGFSSHFKNIITPPTGAPSLIITNCNNSHKFYERKGFAKYPDRTEGPIKWSFKEDTEVTCIKYPDEIAPTCTIQDCFVKTFTLRDKEYTDLDITNLCLHISNRTYLTVEYNNNRVSFRIGKRWTDKYGFKRCYIMMHDSFSKSFRFDKRIIESYEAESGVKNFSGVLKKMVVGGQSGRIATVRTTSYNGHKYDVFYIDHTPDDQYIMYGKKLSKEWGIDVSLTSNIIDLSKPAFPKTIKIVCDNIEAQIFNSEYSKNMLVYTPDFNKLKSYTTQEIESVDYMPLSNTLLTEMRFKLLDENNEQIHLLPGAATWLKLSLRSMPTSKKSFNAVLTSENSTYYDKNSQSLFRVKLPSPLNLNQSWKVCASSLSHPSNFATFLSPENDGEKETFQLDRTVAFYEGETNEETSFAFNTEYTYNDSNEIIGQINKFLSAKSFGSATLENDFVNINLSKTGNLVFGESIARVLGHTGSLTRMDDKVNVLSIDSSLTSSYKFGSKINIEYFYPKYIMVYSNIIQPVLVAGEYRKLLRISPVEKQEVAYVTNYFRHKEFTKLENTFIDTIEIVLASHDGRKICFGSSQDVIINIEFSNHSDDYL